MIIYKFYLKWIVIICRHKRVLIHKITKKKRILQDPTCEKGCRKWFDMCGELQGRGQKRTASSRTILLPWPSAGV